MIVEVEGVSYQFISASNVIRDGIALECWRDYGVNGLQGTLVAEVFRYEPTRRFTVSVFEQELPFVLIESFMREAARWARPGAPH